MLPSDASLAEQLSHLRTTSVAVVCFGYHQQVLHQEGFGYLIPSSEGERLLGVVWDSSVFPVHNQTTDETRLTCMIGGEHMPNFAAHSADDFIAIAREGLERHLGIRAKPDVVTVKLATQAIPQYTMGHSKRVAEITRGLQLLSPRLRLLGNSYSGVAVNDCIAAARTFFTTEAQRSLRPS
jgi:oxygen-dependent protoporphyrinogen oxidase